MSAAGGGVTLSDLRDMLGSARGRKAAPQGARVVRELVPSDMDLLLAPPPKGSQAPLLTRIRTRHHHLARLLAEGESPGTCAIITGYSNSRISILQQDPAFQDLVAYYAAQAAEKFLDVHAKLAGLGTDVVEELHERLDTEPERFSVKDLLALGEFALDRSVAPPKSRAGTDGRGVPAISISFHGNEPPPVVIHQDPLLLEQSDE